MLIIKKIEKVQQQFLFKTRCISNILYIGQIQYDQLEDYFKKEYNIGIPFLNPRQYLNFDQIIAVCRIDYLAVGI